MVVIAASLAQSAPMFAALAATLLWSAALPRWNPFDAVYNRLFAARSGFRLHAAPGPRRFAQALAGMLSLLVATLLTVGQKLAAIVVEVLFLGAIAALVFGGLCFGSYVFHLLKGRKTFAHRTMPWS